MPDGRVTAVVVNYRSGDDLETCLAALTVAGGPLERVVVVDNASGDGSWRAAADLAEVDPRVELVRSESNLGLAGAVNLVLPGVATEYLAVLNPDSTPQPGWLDPLVGALATDPTAVVACPLVLVEATGEVNSAGQHLHVTGLGFNRHLHQRPERVGGAVHPVGGLHGAAFLIRTETLRRLGGWDETGFLYHEDVALSWDVALMGRRVVCVPESIVFHDYHLTMYPEKLYLLERNRWAMLLSHLPRWWLLLISPALLLTEVMVWGLCLVRGPSFLRAKARSYAWLTAHRDEVAAWRRRVEARPGRDLARLRRSLRWSYPLDQVGALGSERGRSTRRPPGGLPV